MTANKIKYLAAVLIAMAGLQQAKADQISFNLSVGNSPFNTYPGPYVSVTVNRTSSTSATITFTSLTASGNAYLMGDGASVGVNVNATSWTLSSITGSNSGTGFTPGPYSNGGSGNVDGFGVLNQTINTSAGFTHSSSMIRFTLTNTSGSWLTAASVLVANANGAMAAAHIFVTKLPLNAANGSVCTGFAANGGAGVPDGGTTVMLLGAALGALGVVRRYLTS